MAKLFVLLINQRSAPAVSADDIQGKLDAVVLDWLRVAPSRYFVRYDGGSNGIYEAIKPLFRTEDDILVCELAPNTVRGWASKMAAEWFAKYTD